MSPDMWACRYHFDIVPVAGAHTGSLTSITIDHEQSTDWKLYLVMVGVHARTCMRVWVGGRAWLAVCVRVRGRAGWCLRFHNILCFL